MIATPSLTFSEATNKATNDIFKISGRSRRSEFWWTMGVVYLVNVFRGYVPFCKLLSFRSFYMI